MKRQAETKIPTTWGELHIVAYAEQEFDQPHLALMSGYPFETKVPWVRMHSECMTGDTFGSLKCDCGEQLHYSLDKIQNQGGIIIYLRQEGRGIGLINKLRAYELQRTKGLDTIESNTHLGFVPDDRDYHLAIEILQDLEVDKIRLLTNNPDKIDAIEQSPIELVSVEPVIINPHKENYGYLLTKQNEMGHLLNLNGFM